jgi:hypothetical protein
MKAMVTSSGGCYLLEGIWAPEQILFVVTVVNSNSKIQTKNRNIRHASSRYFLVVQAKFALIYLIMACLTGTLVNICSRIE